MEKDSLIDTLNFDETKWSAIGILFVIALSLRVFAFFSLAFVRKNVSKDMVLFIKNLCVKK